MEHHSGDRMEPERRSPGRTRSIESSLPHSIPVVLWLCLCIGQNDLQNIQQVKEDATSKDLWIEGATGAES